jgi:transposase
MGDKHNPTVEEIAQISDPRRRGHMARQQTDRHTQLAEEFARITREAAIELRRQGKTMPEIAQDLGVSKQRIHQWVSERETAEGAREVRRS